MFEDYCCVSLTISSVFVTPEVKHCSFLLPLWRPQCSEAIEHYNLGKSLKYVVFSAVFNVITII